MGCFAAFLMRNLCIFELITLGYELFDIIKNNQQLIDEEKAFYQVNWTITEYTQCIHIPIEG